jgi:very-short-patch-repair endonuclease
LKHQFKVDWCKNNKLNILWPYDFCIPELKAIIELDGLQHFEQVSSWKKPEVTQKRDLYKMKCANENGYSIIRILQEDVFNDKYDWLVELKLNIEKIVSEKKVQNIFMCKNDEYNIFNNIDYSLVNKEELPDDIEDTETNDNIMKID